MDIVIFLKFFAGVNIDDTSSSILADPKFTYTRNGTVVTDVTEYANEEPNRKLPSIISMVIASLIPPSTCPSDYADKDKTTALTGDHICDTFKVSFALIIMVAVSVPIMLCTRPCIAKFSAKHSHVAQHYDQVNE